MGFENIDKLSYSLENYLHIIVHNNEILMESQIQSTCYTRVVNLSIGVLSGYFGSVLAFDANRFVYNLLVRN